MNFFTSYLRGGASPSTQLSPYAQQTTQRQRHRTEKRTKSSIKMQLRYSLISSYYENIRRTQEYVLCMLQPRRLIQIHHHKVIHSTTTVFVAIILLNFFDRFGIDEGCREDRSYDNVSSPKRPIISMSAQRRLTTVRVHVGDAVIIDSEISTPKTVTIAHNDDIVLLLPEDKERISSFLYELMYNLQLVHLNESDGYDNLPNGLPGLACKHCLEKRTKKTMNTKRSSQVIFTQYRRTLPRQIRNNLYNHIRKCEHVQPEIKLELKRLKKLENDDSSTSTSTSNKETISKEERIFFKLLWSRMGHKTQL